MDDNTKIADLTVTEFRELMQRCFDADRNIQHKRRWELIAAQQGTGIHDYIGQQMIMRSGIPSPRDAF